MACVNEISNHLDGEYGTISCIRRDLSNIANSFINIGFRLYEADTNCYYAEKGYDSVYEMAEKELDMKKSVVSRYINIYKRFHAVQGKKMDIAPQYEKFNYSQLCEMLPLTDFEIKQLGIDENMPVSQIRQLKKQGRSNAVENCDVATDSEDEIATEDSSCEADIVSDAEYVEVKKKSFDEVMTFLEFYSSKERDLLSDLEEIVKHNVKKDISVCLFGYLSECFEVYHGYLKNELGE